MPLTITPEDVTFVDDASTIQRVTAAEAVAQGQIGYNAGSNQFGLAINNDTELKSIIAGVFLLPAALGLPTQLLTQGKIKIGATVQVGVSYFLGSTGGIIFTESELVIGQYVSFLGIAVTTEVIHVNPFSSKVLLT